MAQNFRKIVDGIELVAKTASTVNTAGDIDFNTTNSKLTLYNGTVASPIVTESSTATLTNKSIDAGSNSITNLTNANLNGSAGITGANLAVNTVTNSNLAQMGSFTIKGNDSGSTANAADLTSTQVTSMLNVFSSSLKGLVPASGGGTTNFLRADGTFATPSGTGGTVSTIGTYDSQAPSANALVISGANLYAQSASTTNPGMVNTLAQSFTGNKTFISQVSTPLLTDNGAGLTIEPSNNQNLILTTFAAGRLQLTGGEGVDLKQISTPAQPASGYDTLYFKSDDNLYRLTTTGHEAPAGGQEFHTSSAVTTQSTALSSTSFTTFSNSPAFTFTPNVSGTFKVYCNAFIQQNSGADSSVQRIFNTSGGATLLSESQGIGYVSSPNALVASVGLQSVYTLTAGVSYVFDIQSMANVGTSSTQLGIANTFKFYMFAERVSN